MKDVMLLSEEQYFDLFYLQECTHGDEEIHALMMDEEA